MLLQQEVLSLINTSKSNKKFTKAETAMLMVTLQWILRVEESDPFADVEEDEEELEENELVLEDCLYYAFYNPLTVTTVYCLPVLILQLSRELAAASIRE